MKYETIAVEFMGETQEYIMLDKGNDEFESFPVDSENPRYQQFLLDLEQENN